MNRKSNTGLRPTTAAARHLVARQLLAVSTLAAGLSAGAPVQAAGGHHSVDDAALLEPGQCQLETWWDRERGGARALLHAGAACRVGPVELGLSADRLHLDGTGSTGASGAQVKWARPVHGGWSAGVVFGLAMQDRSPRFLGSTLLVPVTWQASNTLLAHASAGRDVRHGQPDTNRAGLALEWVPLTAWSVVAERFRESGANAWRAGARWSPTPSLALDFSRARGLDAVASAGWTLGLTWVVDR